MLYIRSWLQSYVDIDNISDTQLADTISLKSGECEGFEQITERFNGKVLVGLIQNCRKHPDADTLQIFDVNIGALGMVQICSAAGNARDGLVCPVAIEGAKLPFLNIAPRKMRGVESDGMGCGMSELALETGYSAGLWELWDINKDADGQPNLFGKLPDETTGQKISNEQVLELLGKSVCEALPQFFAVETVFEVKYLQDRLASCSSHLGMAIEIARILEQPNLLKGTAKQVFDNTSDWQDKVISDILKLPTKNTIKFEDKTNSVNQFNLLNLELRSSYDLPHIVQQRLSLINQNLTGSVADFSNYLLFDIGQPTHFFSVTKILDKDWKIDQLENETKFAGLGQLKNTVLKQGQSVMQDKSGNVLTVPGISGSESTKTEAKDTNLLIEIANFDSQFTAQSSFDLNYRSEAAKFWNSGVANPLTLIAILEIAKEFSSLGDLSVNMLWNNFGDYENATANLKKAFVPRLMEIDLWDICDRLDHRLLSQNRELLESKLNLLGSFVYPDNLPFYDREKGELDFAQLMEAATVEGLLVFAPNPFGTHIKSREDVIFEVAKLIGLENLKPEYIAFSTQNKTKSQFKLNQQIKSLFVESGISEVITRPFLPENKLHSSIAGGDQKALFALSSVRQNEPYLRDSLLPCLLTVVAKNLMLGIKSPKVFELTKIYTKNNAENQFAKSLDGGQVLEHTELGAVITTEDPYQITTLIHSLLKSLKLEQYKYKKVENNIGQGIVYTVQGKQIQITLTQVSNKIKKQFELPLNKSIWYLEIYLDPQALEFNPYRQYKDESNFPIIKRSYTINLSKFKNWSEILATLQSKTIAEVDIAISPVERISISETEDKVNFEIEFSSYHRTLTSEEIATWESVLE